MRKLDDMKRQFHTLQYEPNGQDCPYFLSQHSVPEEWEWRNYEVDPYGVTIVANYRSQITDPDVKFIDFDFYGSDAPYVSDRFLAVCDEFSVRYRAVPVEITLRDGTRPEKPYFFFLPADQLSLLDPERSIAEIDRVKETGAQMMDKIFPDVPVYSKIEKFVVKDDVTPHLFQCIEIFSLVCTDEFFKMASERGLRGIKFTPIDEAYVYDPWADW